MIFKFLVVLLFIESIKCMSVNDDKVQQQQNPLPAPIFGRVFPQSKFQPTLSGSNSIKDNVCLSPNTYGFVQRSGTNKYYAFADLQMAWIDAETYCQSFGAHLPILKNLDDTNFLRWFVGPRALKPMYSSTNRTTTNGGYWVGGYRSVETNSFKWIDGSSFSYNNWYAGEPNNIRSIEDFMCDWYSINLSKYLGWNDTHGDIRMVVACELKC